MLPDVKSIQQNLTKRHPNLEAKIKTRINKFLKSKLIFLVKHSKWLSDIVPVRKKNEDIRICIDFINLNKACEKGNFPLPPMKFFLQGLAGSELISFLYGFSGYN